jgi:hypothetical protein
MRKLIREGSEDGWFCILGNGNESVFNRLFERLPEALERCCVRNGDAHATKFSAADLLFDKYGPPKKIGTKLQWIFPTATIELTRMRHPKTGKPKAS